MSFWKFGFSAPVNSIESILTAHEVALAALSPEDQLSNPQQIEIISGEALDKLLGHSDLLSEVKVGNSKLNDFLAKGVVVQRLAGWILWGLGEGLIGGIVKDGIQDGPVMITSMGGVPKRRDMDQFGVLEGDANETVEEKASAGFPRLATELISSDTPNLSNILFNHSAASSDPNSCPSPQSFLIPFWETLLESTELQLETRSVQVGYWARVNGVLLSGPHGLKVLTIILCIPSIIPRLLNLLPFCSPINDLLLMLIRISSPPPNLLLSVVPQALQMLNPLANLGVEGHVAADELLRGIIELSSAAPILIAPPLNGTNGQTLPEEETWRENGLARQIADSKNVQMLLDWMLLDSKPELSPKPPPLAEPDETIESKLKTSSLIQSISVLVDLIRKNNSDYVEQQMLIWARRKEAGNLEKEMLAEEMDQELSDSLDQDRGPCLIDLGALLGVVSERLQGFQELVRNPRSLQGPVPTTAGLLIPLTLERFRICEFYAELLHCSNMSLLNRPTGVDPLYDSEGYLLRGWKAADELSEALSAEPVEEEDRDYRPPFSPPMPTRLSNNNTAASSPIEMAISYSNVSTPCGSLDSESGILTRIEAKELKDLLRSHEQNPFDDPDAGDILVSRVSAAVDAEAEATLRKRNSYPLITPVEIRIKPRNLVNGEISSSVAPLAAGPLLKRKFIQIGIIETMLDLFFEFPWNNLLHNVVFDILQQIFHGRIDRSLDRQLALSVFLDAHLIDRILAGQLANDVVTAQPKGVRLGYMGHMSLISEEIVKLFHHYPIEIHSVLKSKNCIPPAWEEYVSTTLRATRDLDLTPLGNFGNGRLAGDSGSSSASGASATALSDEDDEFPTSKTIRGNNGFLEQEVKKENIDADSGDQFSRYLAQAIDRPDRFGSSDEDEDSVAWLEGNQHDYSNNSSKKGPRTFGFGEERFEEAASRNYRDNNTDSDDDTDWGNFNTKASTSNNIDFSPSKFSSPGSGFDSSFADEFASPSGLDSDDEFGDFEGGSSISQSNSPSPSPALEPKSILLPSLNSEEDLEDFDFGEFSPTISQTPVRPFFGRKETMEDDGSGAFGGFDDAFGVEEATNPVTSTSSTIIESANPTSDSISVSTQDSSHAEVSLEAELS